MKAIIEKYAPIFVNVITKRFAEIEKNVERPFFSVPRNTNFLPQNIRGNFYKSSNAFFLYMLCEEKEYKTPVFLTFKQAQELEISILKGSKSFPVKYKSFTIIHKETEEKISLSEYRALPKEEQENYKVYSSLKYYNVFNLDDTNYSEVYPQEWERLLERFRKEEPKELLNFDNQYLEELLLMKSWLCPIELKMSDNAFYSPLKDEIVLPLKSQFTSVENFYSTLLHEMSHSTGNEARLNRKILNKFGTKLYAHEELVAELSAAMTGIFTGVSVSLRKENLSYIANWLQLFKSDPEYLYNVMEDASRASNLICETLNVVFAEDEIVV